MPPEHGPIPGDSVERKVFAEHRRLDALFEEVRDSFRPTGSPEATREALGELRAALETHFDQEDRLYYPAIWALRPDLKPELKSLVDSHADFLAQFDRMAALLERSEGDEARAVFDHLSAVFERHEGAEEGILSALDREIRIAR